MTHCSLKNQPCIGGCRFFAGEGCLAAQERLPAEINILDKPPSAWIPENDPIVLAVIGKLGEEAAELSKACFRAIIQGLHECEPVTGEKNFDAIWREAADVQAQIKNAQIQLDLPLGFMVDRARKKCSYIQAWIQMLRAMGA